MAFFGTSKVTLDNKGRFAIPTRYRDAIHAECGGKMWVTLGPRKELWLLTDPSWVRLNESLASRPVTDPFRNRLINNADPVDVDRANGRVLIPSGLREKGILPNPNLAFRGGGNHFEVWDWDTHMQVEEDDQPAVEASAADFNF